MPHVSLHGSKPIHERSGRELILLFVVFPVSVGVAMLTGIVCCLVQYAHSFTWKDWLTVAWGVTVSTVLMIGLPGAAWKEWQRRKLFRRGGTAESQQTPFNGDSATKILA